MNTFNKNSILGLIAAILLLGIAGIYYANKDANEGISPIPGSEVASTTPSSTATSTENVTPALPTPASGVSAPSVTPFVSASLAKCETEIKADIAALTLNQVQVRYEKGVSFTTAAEARDFLIKEGFTNDAGHGSIDLSQTASTDIVVAILEFKSPFIEEKDGRQIIRVITITQPIVCLNGKIAPKSKNFLTVTIKNEQQLRAAMYLKDKEKSSAPER